jgi:ABC-type Fe3+/spermidine/putrescine transport system ATPase subunit
MRIIIQNFRCYSYPPAVFNFSKGCVIRLDGPSGSGKSTILLSILWCLFGGMRGAVKPMGTPPPPPKGSNAIVPGIPPSATAVVLELPEMPHGGAKIRRTAAATSSLEVFTPADSKDPLKPDAAIAWILSEIGTIHLWTASSYIPQGDRNPLMTLSNADKFSLLYELTFATPPPSLESTSSAVSDRSSPEYFIKEAAVAANKMRSIALAASVKTAATRDMFDMLNNETPPYKHYETTKTSSDLETEAQNFLKKADSASNMATNLSSLQGKIDSIRTMISYLNMGSQLTDYEKTSLRLETLRETSTYCSQRGIKALQDLENLRSQIGGTFSTTDLKTAINCIETLDTWGIQVSVLKDRVSKNDIVSSIRHAIMTMLEEDVVQNSEVLKKEKNVYSFTEVKTLRESTISRIEAISILRNKGVEEQVIGCESCGKEINLMSCLRKGLCESEDLTLVVTRLETIENALKAKELANSKLLKIREFLPEKCEEIEIQFTSPNNYPNLEAPEFPSFLLKAAPEFPSFLLKASLKDLKLAWFSIQEAIEEKVPQKVLFSTKKETTTLYILEEREKYLDLQKLESHLKILEGSLTHTKQQHKSLTHALNLAGLELSALGTSSTSEECKEAASTYREQSRSSLENASLVLKIERLTNAKNAVHLAVKDEQIAFKKSTIAAEAARVIADAAREAVSDTVAQISSNTNAILAELFKNGNPMRVSFELSKRGGSPTANSVYISIAYKGTIYDGPKFLSGGETDRLSLALTIAISSVSRSPLILLDECMASLDDELRERCFHTIRKFLPHKTVINICHSIASGHHDEVLSL